MTILTRFPSSNAADGTAWTNPAYAYNNDGVQLATATPGRNKTVASRWGNFGFDSLIPAGSTINSVTVNVNWKVSAAGFAYDTLGFQPYIDGVANGSEYVSTTESTTLALRSASFTGLTRDNLLDASLTVRVRATQGSSGTAFTESLDYVSVTVDYTAPLPVLEIQDGAQVQTAENVDLTAKVNIVVQDGSQIQTSGGAGGLGPFPQVGVLDDFEGPDGPLSYQWMTMSGTQNVVSGKAVNTGPGVAENTNFFTGGTELFFGVAAMPIGASFDMVYGGYTTNDHYVLRLAKDPMGDLTVSVDEIVQDNTYGTGVTFTASPGVVFGVGIRHFVNGDIKLYFSTDGGGWVEMASGNYPQTLNGGSACMVFYADTVSIEYINEGTITSTTTDLQLTTQSPPSNDLVVQKAEQIQTAENVDLTAQVNIAVQDASQAQTAENVALVQVNSLQVSDGQQVQTAENVVLTAKGSLVVADGTQVQTAESPTLGVTSILTVADASQLSTAESPSLTAKVNLAVDDASQAQTAENLDLTTSKLAVNLVVDNATQLQTAESPELVVVKTLAIEDATQLQTAENAVLTAISPLVVQDGAQAQTAEEPALTQTNHLIVGDGVQVQTAEDVALTAKVNLSVDDAAQIQTAENIELLSGNSLAVQDAAQIQTAENVIMTGTVNMAVQGGAQAQTAENVALTSLGSLVVDDGRQPQTADSPALTAKVNLSVDDGRQIQTAENIELTSGNSLEIQDGRSVQIAENVTLTGKVNLVVQDGAQTQTPDPIVLTTTTSLVVQDGRQVQVAETPVLRCLVQLVVQDASQVQTVDSLILSVISNGDWVIDKGVMTQTVDNIELRLTVNLGVNKAIQVQVVDPITLSALVNLAVQKGRQIPLSDNLTLTILGLLDVEDGLQLMTSDELVLITGDGIPFSEGVTLILEARDSLFSVVLDSPVEISRWLASPEILGELPVEVGVDAELESEPTISSTLSEETW